MIRITAEKIKELRRLLEATAVAEQGFPGGDTDSPHISLVCCLRDNAPALLDHIKAQAAENKALKNKLEELDRDADALCGIENGGRSWQVLLGIPPEPRRREVLRQ